MKNIIKFMMLLAGVAMLATACKKELVLSDMEGSVSLNIEMEPATRADEDGSGETEQFIPENILVRIYRGAKATGETGDQLIRRYNKMEDIPNPLYLMADKYTVKVDAGDTSNKSFKQPTSADELKEKLCYSGTQTFTIAAQQNTNIAVNCKTINTKFNVGFDISDGEKDYANDNNYNDDNKPTKYENRLLSNVKITVAAITTSATTVEDLKADITSQKAPKLEFAGDELNPTDLAQGQTAGVGSGYFLMPEGVTTLVWAFEGEHEKDGSVAQMGKVTVQAGYAYTVNFKYSRTPDGYAGITVVVDDEVEIKEDSFYFKPQPQISGSIRLGSALPTPIDAEGANVFKQGSSLELVCESINDLTDISLGGVEFYNERNVVDNHGITGLTATKESDTKVTFTISEAYFNNLQGSTQNLRFVMTDTEEDPYEQILTFKKRGIVLENTKPDLWLNTVAFEAFIPEGIDDGNKVYFQYKKEGATDYNTIEAIAGANGTYTATSTAGWATGGTSEIPYYTPIVAQNIFANNEYEYRLLVSNPNNIASATPIESAGFTTTTDQTIPDASFENSGLTCFTTSSAAATFWGSGNNSITKNLCAQAQMTGQVGGNCVKLGANDPGVLNMMAAGNIFTGQFNMNGMNGTVSFGVKYVWEARPTAIKLKYYAQIGTATHNTYGSYIAKGSQDQASIYVAIIDWDAQHKVTSGGAAPTGVWSPENGPDAVSEGEIIGYGIVYPNQKMNGGQLVDLEIPIKYYDKVTKPSKNYTLIIAASTSRYGDYMNGCASNVMYIDNFEWVY